MSTPSRRRTSACVAILASFTLLASTTVAAAPPEVDDVASSGDPPNTNESPDENDAEDLDDTTADPEVDHSASWGPTEPPTPSPTPSTTPPPMPTEVPPPSPPSQDPEYQSKLRAAEGTAIAGYVFVGLGAVTLVLLSGPAWIAAQVARDRADDDPILVSEQELHRRAERRLRFAKISAIAGGSSLFLGGILIAAGLGSRATLRAQQRELAIAPLLGPTQGLQMRLRF